MSALLVKQKARHRFIIQKQSVVQLLVQNVQTGTKSASPLLRWWIGIESLCYWPSISMVGVKKRTTELGGAKREAVKQRWTLPMSVSWVSTGTNALQIDSVFHGHHREAGKRYYLLDLSDPYSLINIWTWWTWVSPKWGGVSERERVFNSIWFNHFRIPFLCVQVHCIVTCTSEFVLQCWTWSLSPPELAGVITLSLNSKSLC